MAAIDDIIHQPLRLRIMAGLNALPAGTGLEFAKLKHIDLPEFKSITWFGLVAPPATPAVLAEKINRDVVEILHGTEVGEMLHRISLEAGATAPSETSRFFAEETALWSKVIKEAGIEPQ